MSNTAPFVVVPELTAIAIAYRNQESSFVADGVMPRVKEVSTKEFKYLIHDLSSFDLPESLVGRKGRPNEVDFSSSDATAAVEDHGLEDPIPQDDIDQGRVAKRDIMGEATEYVMGLVRLNREYRVATIAQDAANYAPANVDALSGTSKYSSDASDPIKTMLEYLDTPIARPNTVVMPGNILTRLRTHPKVVQAIYPGATGGTVTRQQIQDLLEIETLLIGQSRANFARKGQGADLRRVWGNHIAMLYLDKAASTQRGVTWGMTVPYGKPVGGTIDDPYIGLRGGKRVRAGESLKELVTCKDVGFLIQNVL